MSFNWITTINLQYRVDIEGEALAIQRDLKAKYDIKNFSYKRFEKKDKKTGEIIEEYYIVDVELNFNDKKDQTLAVTVDITTASK